MLIKQFEYQPLAHYSYAIIDGGKMAVIDPERDPEQYYDFAKAHNAKIVAVIQTHPHADFVSSHLEIHKETGADIYNSAKLGAEYPHKAFDDGDSIQLGNTILKAINTPGHSPDSITIVATDDQKIAIFTGDTLFIGDIGRPDLREKAGTIKAKREELAEMMYDTIRNKFNDLPDSTLVYPAHGAGSLCGKHLSEAASSTLGDERMNNWAFKEQSKEKFMETLLDGQLFIPAYFGYNVGINKEGAEPLNTAIDKIPFIDNGTASGLIIDTRDHEIFKNGHLKGSINIQAESDTAKFETWLGTIVRPEEEFTLVVDSEEKMDTVLHRVAKIGYEKQLKQVITIPVKSQRKSDRLDISEFKNHPEKFTIVDVRNESEIKEEKIFDSSLAFPLNELRQSAKSIPSDKPVVVHCAGGYRSAIGSSILEDVVKPTSVFDLGEEIESFMG